MNNSTDSYILSQKDEIIRVLREVLSINSEKSAPADGAPFGVGVKQALTYLLKTARDFGFSCEDKEGYVGCVDYGDGEEMLGVLCHADVVPANDGWTYPPYSATIHDGKIYARGAIDDKGPTVSALFALAAIKACGIPLKRRVRIMIGCDEESGWGCMNYYKAHCEEPTLAFSPDGNYPLVYSEKGIMQVHFQKKFSSEITFDAGTCANAVPDLAKLTVTFGIESVNEAINKAKLSGFGVSTESSNKKTVITISGVGAHASYPNLGKNVIQAGLQILVNLPLSGDDADTVSLLNGLYKMEYYGETLGLDVQDESGRQTVNLGIMHWDSNGISRFATDMRCPNSVDINDLYNRYTAILTEKGFTIAEDEVKKGHFVPRDSELVQKLMDVYVSRTGKHHEPLAIGGGTYARAFKNAVAFGCEPCDEDSVCHIANEFISIDALMENTLMMADAIIALAGK